MTNETDVFVKWLSVFENEISCLDRIYSSDNNRNKIKDK